MKVVLSRREQRLVSSRDVCRMSTISGNGWPHSIPVSYLYQHGRFYIPSAPHTRKVRNLRENNKATIVIDNEDTEHGIMLECSSKLLRGAKAEPYRKHMREIKGWKNDDTTVVIELDPLWKTSWFLK